MNRAWVLLILGLLIPARLGARLSASSPDEEESWRLDCGTADLPAFPADANAHTVDADGNLWLQDEPFGGLFRWGYENGQTASSNHAIAGTTLDAIYQSHRYGQTDMRYRIRLPNGTYRLRLLFAETNYTAAGARVFDVSVQGVTVLDDHDVFAHVGADAADEHVFGAVVTDGELQVAFPEVAADNAMVSGIAVEAVSVSDDDFLDFLQKRMFFYFLNHANAATGLVPPSLHNWQSEAYDAGGLAATGLGLSVLAVGAARGWLTPADALTRINAALASLENPGVQARGFPYSRLGHATGFPAPGALVSSFEAGQYLLSAVAAAEYFRDASPALAQRVETINQNMDWSWWQNRVRDGADPAFALAKNWRPASGGGFVIPSSSPAGFFEAAWWSALPDGAVPAMAAAGGSSPAPASAANDLERPWRSLFGLDVLDAPALSQHQSPHLFFDLRSRSDSHGTNHFEAARRATLVNRLTCLEDPRFAADRWGLSGAYGPGDVYRLYGPAPNPGGLPDGTVDPNASLTSLPFTPAESLAAARHMFFQYKHQIWGLHGFVDGFNVDQDYRAARADGVDLGAAILAIENHRSGLPWARFMASAQAARSLAAAGFTAGAPGQTASSSVRPPSFAADGDPATAWESAAYDPQWWSLDLGSQRALGQVSLLWEGRQTRRYQIQVSQDGAQWTTVAENTGDALQEAARFDPVSARFVRFYGLTGAPYVLREFTVGAAGAAGARAFPNPFRPSQGFLTLSGLPAGAEVRLYTFSGIFLRTLAADAFGSAHWDGTDGSGAGVASGSYTAAVPATGQKMVIVLQR